jgi:hypothetical protein
MRTVVVTLDGTDYEIQELRSKANRAWREHLEAHFAELSDALVSAPDTDITDGVALAEMVRSVSGKLLHSVDIVADLVRIYDENLPIDDAYDSEILEAFTAILGLAYPFGAVIDRVREAVGQLNQATSQS